MKCGYVYSLANKRNGTIYIGVTSNIEQRLEQHKHHYFKGFTSKYNVKFLVYLEEFSSISDALQREKALKRWNRKWKLDLIERVNPNWLDLTTGTELCR